ncbi:MAG: hypothetical protein ACTSSH_01990 [Candidatus Heimdallarchaeota archaeon]
MKKWYRNGIIVLILTVSLAFIPIANLDASKITDTPSVTSSLIISYRKPVYNSPVHIFNVQYNGIIVVRYNWTDNIGHSCNAMWLNFWDHEELSPEEQINEGTFGHLWMTKCSNNRGTFNITISDKVTTRKLGIYLEVDTDQMFTGTLQDPIILDFEFYPYEGQINFLIYLND